MRDFNHDMINRYLDGELNTEEIKAFEAEMQQDPEFRKEVELTREVNSTLRMKFHPDKGELELRNTLDHLRSKFFTNSTITDKPKAKVIMFRRTMLVAAAAAVVVFVMLTIWSPWKKDLYQQYAYIKMPAVAERGEPVDSILRAITGKFNDKKFAETLPLFESILINDAKNSFIHYYYGIALLENAQFDRSRSELTLVLNGTSLFRYDAAFYMALSYLKQKDKNSCREWLKKIPEDAGVYAKAMELLKKL